MKYKKLFYIFIICFPFTTYTSELSKTLYLKEITLLHERHFAEEYYNRCENEEIEACWLNLLPIEIIQKIILLALLNEKYNVPLWLEEKTPTDYKFAQIFYYQNNNLTFEECLRININLAYSLFCIKNKNFIIKCDTTIINNSKKRHIKNKYFYNLNRIDYINKNLIIGRKKKSNNKIIIQSIKSKNNVMIETIVLQKNEIIKKVFRSAIDQIAIWIKNQKTNDSRIKTYYFSLANNVFSPDDDHHYLNNDVKDIFFCDNLNKSYIVKYQKHSGHSYRYYAICMLNSHIQIFSKIRWQKELRWETGKTAEQHHACMLKTPDKDFIGVNSHLFELLTNSNSGF